MNLMNREEQILAFRPRNIQPIKDEFICTECNKVSRKIKCIRGAYNTWKDKDVCVFCWYLHSEERELVWRYIQGMDRNCQICGGTCIVNGVRVQNCNFDHINIFTKEYNICDMIDKGIDIELIKKEAKKCRLLCIGCHDEVTEKQRESGWIQLKSNYTRAKNRGEVDESLRDRLCEKYNRWLITSEDFILTLIVFLIRYSLINQP